MRAAKLELTVEPPSAGTVEASVWRVTASGEQIAIRERAPAASEPPGVGVMLPQEAQRSSEPTAPEAWMAKLAAGLSPDENAKLDKMKGGKTLAEQRAMFDGDLEASRKKVRDALRDEQEAAATKAQSKVRVEELRQEIVDKGLMKDPEIRAIVDDVSKKPKDKLPALRDKLMSKLLKAQTQAAHPSADVFDGVKMYEKLPEATIAGWKAKHPGQKIDGLTERDDGLYMQRGEVDMMVVERGSGGARGKILSRQEIKTGVVDTDAKAKSQLKTQTDLFKDAAGGAKKLRLEVGDRDIADEVDLASDAFASKSSRGPAGKGFDNSLGMTASDLEALCKDLLKSSPVPEKTP
jgi:polyhydroxyalkanoate synthesis regulator phasin